MVRKKEKKKSCILNGVKIVGIRRRDVIKIPKRFTPIYTVNMEFLYWADKILEFRRALNSGLTVPDGRAVVWLMRLKCKLKSEHLPGSRIIFDFLELADREGMRVLMLGSTDEVLKETKKRLEIKYRNAEFYIYNPGVVCYPFNRGVLENISNYIETIQPHMIFVALGPPKQELLIHKLRNQFERSNVLLAMGVGGTFNMIAGKERLAPEWITKAGLEWLWRLFSDLSRIKKVMRSLYALGKVIVS